MKTNFWLHCCGKFFANALIPTVDNQYWPVLIKQQYWPCWPTLTCGQIYKWGLVSYLLCWINFKFAKETLIKISNSLKQCSYPFLIYHANLLSFILGRIKNNKNRSVSQLSNLTSVSDQNTWYKIRLKSYISLMYYGGLRREENTAEG